MQPYTFSRADEERENDWKNYSQIYKDYIEYHNEELLKNPDLNEVRDYLKNRNLNYDYCGIRPKHVNNDFSFFTKKLDDDSFIINLFGIESPGLTSSIQIGKYVLNILKHQNVT